MALDIEIAGGDQLKALARQISVLGDQGLGREMGRALRASSEPVQRSIRREYEDLPRRGGYAALFSKSLRFRASLRAAGRTASYQLTTFADGTRERRDIKKLEAGVLRHPVYGRSRRRTAGNRAGNVLANPWAVTRVKGDFHKRGTDNAADLAQREMVKVLDEFANKLIS
jgi:hypothetical protein